MRDALPGLCDAPEATMETETMPSGQRSLARQAGRVLRGGPVGQGAKDPTPEVPRPPGPNPTTPAPGDPSRPPEPFDPPSNPTPAPAPPQPPPIKA
jgi:hypothetical protein